MAAKRHHSSKKQSMLSRYHEYAGEERRRHGLHDSRYENMNNRGEKMYNPDKYDTLRHERDEFNDQNRHDAAPEGSGPYMYDRTSRDGMYAGSMSRRKQEMMDAGMIHEDHSKIANLPQEVRIESYPKCGPWTPEDIDDTIRGVDRQIHYDDSQKMKHFFPKKV